MVGLTFKTGTAPDVKAGNMRGFVVMKRDKEGREAVTFAYYLNAYPLEYDDPCDERGCPKDANHEDGCPTTGWFYDESNFEYENCYYPIGAEIVAWAELPTVADVKAKILESV